MTLWELKNDVRGCSACGKYSRLHGLYYVGVGCGGQDERIRSVFLIYDSRLYYRLDGRMGFRKEKDCPVRETQSDKKEIIHPQSKG